MRTSWRTGAGSARRATPCAPPRRSCTPARRRPAPPSIGVNTLAEADARREITECAERLRRLTGSIG
ncbi:hypothetical protein AB0N15_39030, partial [Streptomyces sp. NPDC051129]